jgi:hypothetical protein
MQGLVAFSKFCTRAHQIQKVALASYTWTRSDILRSRSVAKLHSRSEKKNGVLALALSLRKKKCAPLCARDLFLKFLEMCHRLTENF